MNSMNRNRVWFWLVFLSMFSFATFFAGCRRGGGGNDGGVPAPPANGSATIGAAGETVRSPDGVAFRLPKARSRPPRPSASPSNPMARPS